MDLLALTENNTFLILTLIWTLPWKGVALWKAAGNTQKWWFVVILLTNTFALLDALYIFYFSKKHSDVKTDGKRIKKTSGIKAKNK